MCKRSAILPVSLRLSDVILAATSLHLLIGLATHVLWLVRGSSLLFRYYFAYEDPLFLLLCTGLEFCLAYVAWRQFSPGQLMRHAWLLIMAAAFCHLGGMILSHIIAADSYINPFYALGIPGYKTAATTLVQLGMFIGGPLQMVALMGGLFLALRVCRKLGLRGSLKWHDWVVLGIVIIYALQVAYVLGRLRLGTKTAPTWPEAMNWLNDPLLCVLLFLAFFLRRTIVQMGRSYVTKCWSAYVVAILGTSLASMAMWASDFGVLPYAENAVVWYMWPVIYAAYALGPAYQLEAVRAAEGRGREISSEVQPT